MLPLSSTVSNLTTWQRDFTFISIEWEAMEPRHPFSIQLMVTVHLELVNYLIKSNVVYWQNVIQTSHSPALSSIHEWQTRRSQLLFPVSAAPEEEEGMKSKKTFRSQSVVSQNPEMELMLEGDDDAVSLLQEKEIDNLAGIRHTQEKGNRSESWMVFYVSLIQFVC